MIPPVATTSYDGRYRSNVNHPVGMWTCSVCFSLVMAGYRANHEKDCDKVHTAGGFGT